MPSAARRTTRLTSSRPDSGSGAGLRAGAACTVISATILPRDCPHTRAPSMAWPPRARWGVSKGLWGPRPPPRTAKNGACCPCRRVGSTRSQRNNWSSFAAQCGRRVSVSVRMAGVTAVVEIARCFLSGGFSCNSLAHCAFGDSCSRKRRREVFDHALALRRVSRRRRACSLGCATLPSEGC